MSTEKTDHDLLIELNTSVGLNHTNLVSRITSIDLKIDDNNKTVTKQLTEHDVRIKSLEKINDEVNPKALVLMVQSDHEWIRDFKVTWKTTLRMATAQAAIISFILGSIFTLIMILKAFWPHH